MPRTPLILPIMAMALLLAGVGMGRAEAQPEPPLAAQQDRQAQIQSIESSKDFVIRMQMQQRLEQLRLDRAAREDRHIMLSLYIQMIEGMIVFIIVMLMTGAGIFMSYLQFRKGFSQIVRDGKLLPGNETPPGNVPQPSDIPSSLKISLTGIEVSSSIIGLLVLVVSLAFFFLYLDRVYPIQRLDTGVAVKTPVS